MRAISKRISVLEKAHNASRNEKGQTLAEILRERLSRYDAEVTGRPFEDLFQESRQETGAFWANYTGDRSIAGIVRSRFRT
jgi:hypothetical protein